MTSSSLFQPVSLRDKELVVNSSVIFASLEISDLTVFIRSNPKISAGKKKQEQQGEGWGALGLEKTTVLDYKKK